MLVVVFLVDPEDQLFPDVTWEVQIDVRDTAKRFVEKTAQEKVVLHRIDMRQTDEIADDGRDRRATTPAWWEPGAGSGSTCTNVSSHVPGQVHDVAVDQEEAPKAMKVHQLQLRVEALLGVALFGATRFVPLDDLRQADGSEILHGASPRRALEVREFVAQVLGEIEAGAPLGDEHGVREGLGTAPKSMAHFPRLGEVEEAVGSPGPMGAVQGGSTAYGNQDVLKASPVPVVIVDVPRGHHAQTQASG
jgi:hypothetical protein